MPSVGLASEPPQPTGELRIFESPIGLARFHRIFAVPSSPGRDLQVVQMAVKSMAESKDADQTWGGRRGQILGRRAFFPT